MRVASLFIGAGFAIAAPTTALHASGTPSWVRSYMVEYSSRRVAKSSAPIPAWARKYNMDCSGCHYPAPPRLNATGLRFRWAGYRMPNEIGQDVEAGKVDNYAALGAMGQYEAEKTSGEPMTSTFSLPSLGLWYAGPFGRHYSAFLELDHGEEGEIERVAHVATIWGSERSYGGFRAGQMHNLIETGLAGFDRLPSASAPMPIDGPLSASVPFSLGEHQLGLEAYYVAGRNRLSAQVLNGANREGETAVREADTWKDFLVTDQLLLDDAGSGVQAVGYYGTIVGLDTLQPGLKTHFWRLGLTANKIVGDFELLGTVLYGRDSDLPTAGATENKALGYWVSGQYFVRSAELTLFGRYESLDPNTDLTDDAVRRIVGGSVLPLGRPQYLRWLVEFRLDTPQGGLPKTTNVLTGLSLTF